MAYSSVEFVLTEDSGGRLRITSGDALSVMINALLQDEVDLACRYYEEGGRAAGDELIAELNKTRGPIRAAGVRMFTMARDFGRAARLHEHGKNWSEAARLHAESGDLAAAARCYKQAGDLRNAAQCSDASGEVDEAVALYGKLGDHEAAADCLARSGRALAAARIYRDVRNLRAEVDTLRQVPKTDGAAFVTAAKRLAEILIERNRLAAATELLAEALRETEQGRADLELQRTLAGLFERQGYADHAARLRQHMEKLAPQPAAAPAATAPSAPGKVDAAAELAAAPEEGYSSLKQIPLFSRVEMADLRDIYRVASEVRFASGEVVIAEAVDAPGLITLLEGNVDILAVSGPLTSRLNSLGPGAYLGEISLLSGTLTSARAVATTEVRALKVSREKFDSFLKSHPRAALRIYQHFATNLGERVRALSAL